MWSKYLHKVLLLLSILLFCRLAAVLDRTWIGDDANKQKACQAVRNLATVHLATFSFLEKIYFGSSVCQVPLPLASLSRYLFFLFVTTTLNILSVSSVSVRMQQREEPFPALLVVSDTLCWAEMRVNWLIASIIIKCYQCDSVLFNRTDCVNNTRKYSDKSYRFSWSPRFNDEYFWTSYCVRSQVWKI